MYNLTGVDIVLDITVSNGGEDNAVWHAREFILVARMCNFMCLSCVNSSATGCFSCDPAVPYLLSGTTCAPLCLTGYGNTTDPALCVLCSTNCTMCYEVYDNCSICKNNYYLYLNPILGYTNCYNPCPPLYFANTTAKTCDICHANCTTCMKNKTYCQSCVSGYGWYNFNCFNPCMDFFYSSNSTSNCTKCMTGCITCTDNITCSVCTNISTTVYYLGGTTCHTVCPAPTYGTTNDGNGPQQCVGCDASCATCTGSPSPCQSCNPSYYLYNNTCGTTCPTGYIQYASMNLCLDCNAFCVDVTIAMSFSDSMNRQIYIDMIFTKDLNFTSFDYMNFQTIFISNSQMSSFTVSYAITGNNTYRITVSPIGYIFLYN